MKTIYVLFFLLCSALLAFGNADVTFTLSDSTGASTTNRTIWITPISVVATSGSSIVIGDRYITNSGAGTFTVLNMVPSLYEVTVKAPPMNTTWRILVNTNTTGSVQAATLISTDQNATYPFGSVAYSAAASDGRFLPIPTNNSAGTDGQVASKTGDKTKWITASGTGNPAAAITNLANVFTKSNDFSKGIFVSADPANTNVIHLGGADITDYNRSFYFYHNANSATYGVSPVYTNAVNDKVVFYSSGDNLWVACNLTQFQDGSDFDYFSLSASLEDEWSFQTGIIAPTVHYFGSAIATDGVFEGDGSGISNVVASSVSTTGTGPFIGNNLGQGTNTMFFVGPDASTNRMVLTNLAGLLTLAMLDGSPSNNARFQIQMGGPIADYNDTSVFIVTWNPLHGEFSSGRWHGGEIQLTAPAFGIGIGTDSGFTTYWANRRLQLGAGLGHHAHVDLQYDSTGDKTYSTNSYSNPLRFICTSSNGASVSPALQGWATDATGGSGHAGLRFYYNFDNSVGAESGLPYYNWLFNLSTPSADMIYGGGTASGGLWKFYGDVVSTNFFGDVANATNANATTLFGSGTVPAARLPDLSGTYIARNSGIGTNVTIRGDANATNALYVEKGGVTITNGLGAVSFSSGTIKVSGGLDFTNANGISGISNYVGSGGDGIAFYTTKGGLVGKLAPGDNPSIVWGQASFVTEDSIGFGDTIGGGQGNGITNSSDAVIGGGNANIISNSCAYSTISGGRINTVGGSAPVVAAIIPGGVSNWVSASGAVALGSYITNSTANSVAIGSGANAAYINSDGTAKLIGSIAFVTNSSGTKPNFLLKYTLVTTNAAFTILAPSGVDSTKTLDQETHFYVTNSTALLVNIIPPANVHTNGVWNVTNLTEVIFTCHGGVGFTNATAVPWF